MTIVNNCLLCFKEIEEEKDTLNHSPKLLELCLKYLHSSLAQDLPSQSSKNNFPFCSKCFRSAEELVEISEQMECFQKRISELVFIFSLEILYRRGQTTVFSDKVSNDNSQSVKNLIKFDVSCLPKCDDWNNSSTSSSKSSLSPSDMIQTSKNVYEEEFTDGNTHSNPQDSVVGNVDEMYNINNTKFSSSIGKEAEVISETMSIIPTENILPALKFPRLQFHDNESQVMERETDNVMGVNAQMGKNKVGTSWTRSEFGDSYRNATGNKNSSFDLRLENEDLLYHAAISTVTSNCMDVPSVVDQLQSSNISLVNSSSFDNQHCLASSVEKPFQCSVCSKTFSTQSILAFHKKVHTEERLYSCEVCKRRFKLRHHLLSHSRMHTGERPYKCDYCDKKFANQSNMLSHKRVHTGEKPYRCHFCDKRFAHQSNLLNHKSLHVGEKPFKCDECDYASISRHGLNIHKMVKHSRLFNFKCRECKKDFKTAGAVKQHYKRIHYALDFSDECVIKTYFNYL